jgi:cobalt-precorrin-6B (C15)-methyltransferase
MAANEPAFPALPPGIPDDRFVRADVPMTKAEVRALLMAKAYLHPEARVLDVGAGSGSLSVEAHLLCPRGEVVAIEKDEAALAVLRANLDRFGLSDVRVIAGEAPEAWADQGRFDRVFVGGSDGRLADILSLLPSILRPEGRVICPCVCVETISCAVSYLRGEKWRGFECIQVSIARGVPAGRQLRFEALNPVWIVAAELAPKAAEVTLETAEVTLEAAEVAGASTGRPDDDDSCGGPR